MPWQDLPTNPSDGVCCTITKSLVTVRLGKASLAPLGWDRDTSLKLMVGLDDKMGWLRVEEIDLGPPSKPDGDGVLIETPTSMVPGLPLCRKAPLLFRLADDGLEIQLPAAVTRAHARPVPGRRGAPAAPASPQPVPIKEEYRLLQKEIAAAMHELLYLDNDVYLVDGQIMDSEEEMRRRCGRILQEKAA